MNDKEIEAAFEKLAKTYYFENEHDKETGRKLYSAGAAHGVEMKTVELRTIVDEKLQAENERLKIQLQENDEALDSEIKENEKLIDCMKEIKTSARDYDDAAMLIDQCLRDLDES